MSIKPPHLTLNPSEPIREYSYGAVVFQDGFDGHARLYALVHQSSGGHWDHPKGHIEVGEIPVETAIREVAEEVGVKIHLIDGFYTEASWLLPNGHLKVAGYYLGRKCGQSTSDICSENGEILDVVWLPYKQAQQRITYESGRRILEQAEAFISRAS